MHQKPTFYVAVLILALVGLLGLIKISGFGDSGRVASISSSNQAPAAIATENATAKQTPGLSASDQSLLKPNIKQTGISAISRLIRRGEVLAAAELINEQYSGLTSQQLAVLRSEFLALAFGNKSNAQNILSAASKAFDDLEIWAALGDAALSNEDWSAAFEAHLRASELDSDPTSLEVLLNKLLISGSHIRARYETNNDLLSVKQLYQRLVTLHPNFPRFQYELAIANLKLGDIDNARRGLEPLVFDNDLGKASSQALARLEAETKTEAKPNTAISREAEPSARFGDINVPLVPLGSSFIVKSVIERTPTSLLLDTGASITSLSAELIERLGLQATGQTIRLSTANGLSNARIFRLKQLRLGNLVLRDMLVAEINLTNNRNFQGLLGTDALNQLKPDYSYIIDNQQNALIFRKN